MSIAPCNSSEDKKYYDKIKNCTIFGIFPLLSQVDTTSKISDRKDGFITVLDMNNVTKLVVYTGTYVKFE